MKDINELVSWLERTVKMLLDPEDFVEVRSHKTDLGGYFVVIKTNNQGPIIGQHGSTINSLRLLGVKFGFRMGLKVHIDVAQGQREAA